MMVGLRLGEEDLAEMEKLAYYTLVKVALILQRHESIDPRNTNLWRAALDELLMTYIGRLLEVHINTLQESIMKLAQTDTCEGGYFQFSL